MTSSKVNLEDYIQPLGVEIETLYDLSCRLSEAYTKLAAESSEHFIPTAITQLPTGHETGRYLAVYVGLSYLRVAFIDLLGDKHIEGHARVRRTLEKAWPIEEHLRKDHSADLFTWIGDCIAEVVADRLTNPSEERIDQITTGISFCLPIKYYYLPGCDSLSGTNPHIGRTPLTKLSLCRQARDFLSVQTSTSANLCSMGTNVTHIPLMEMMQTCL